jgi:hypothetical protein
MERPCKPFLCNFYRFPQTDHILSYLECNLDHHKAFFCPFLQRFWVPSCVMLLAL